MSNFALRLPDSLHEHARTLAARDNTSLNQFITMAVAEKVSALDAEAFLQERAARADVDRARALLRRAPDVAPAEGDDRAAPK